MGNTEDPLLHSLDDLVNVSISGFFFLDKSINACACLYEKNAFQNPDS